MKSKLLFYFVLFFFSLSNSQNTTIPDANFEQALIDLGYDVAPIDGFVPTANIENVTILDVNNKNISDLTGIEDFAALNYLFCGNNTLGNLDISQNTSLIQLRCNNNQLTSIDVSNQGSLIELYCSTNQLTSLDISQNSALTSLLAHENQFTSLDVSLNTNLNNFTCSANQLTVLNVKNGNNTNFTQFFASNNPNLTCIEVDDAAYSTANWTNIDVQTSFSEDCITEPLTYVPDDNFEQALIDLGYDSSPLDDYVPTANISILTSLNVSGKNISDLTGIEDFVSLEVLNCLNNQISNLDISTNTALLELRCYSNNLTSLDVYNNTALTLLHCYYNDLTTLDVSNNVLLEDLRCGFTQIEALDLTNNTALIALVSSNLNLTSLDVSNCTALELLRCESNNLTALDVTSNMALTDLYCGYNSISELDLSNNTSLELLNCIANDITELDLSNSPAFTSLSCQSNQLTILNLKNGNNTNAITIITTNNPDLECIEVDNVAYSTDNWSNIDAQSFFSEDCSSLSVDPFETPSLYVYPNPASSFITIDYPMAVEKVEIYNLIGKIVLKEQASNMINISGLSDGIYIMIIHTVNSIVSKKIAKN